MNDLINIVEMFSVVIPFIPFFVVVLLVNVEDYI